MTRRETLDWLANLQAELSSVLRTPLDPSGGTLHTDSQRYPSAICAEVLGDSSESAADRLAIYNRQYWLRLLRALQRELPLTCRLLGPFRFNQVAMRFVLEHPPHERDLGQVAEGFEAFAPRALPGLALREAAAIDCAYRRVFRAPPEPRFEAARGLRPDARLRTSQAHARVTEHWPLVAQRARILAETSERPVALPEPLTQVQTWALVRSARGVSQVMLEPQHARLLTLLEAHPLSEALAQLELECPADARDALPRRVKRWLSRSVKLGMFAGQPT